MKPTIQKAAPAKPEQHRFKSTDGTIHTVDSKWAEIYKTRSDLTYIPNQTISETENEDED